MSYQSAVAPGFAGSTTFLRARTGSLERMTPGSIAVVGVPFDQAGRASRNTSGAPAAIRQASASFAADIQADADSYFVDIDTGLELNLSRSLPIFDLGNLTVQPDQEPLAELQDCAKRLATAGALPVFLGGSTAISGFCAGGMRGALKNSRVAHLCLTGCLDIAADLLSWRRGSTEVPDSDAVTPLDAIVLIGLHGRANAAVFRELQDGGALIISSQQVEDAVADGNLSAALSRLSDFDALYISVDPSLVDMGSAPGAADLVIGGLHPRFAFELTDFLAMLPICAIDVVNVAPREDPTERTARLVFELVLRLLRPRLDASSTLDTDGASL